MSDALSFLATQADLDQIRVALHAREQALLSSKIYDTFGLASLLSPVQEPNQTSPKTAREDTPVLRDVATQPARPRPPSPTPEVRLL